MTLRSWSLSLSAATLLALAGAAAADDAGVVRTHNLDVKERLAHLERIDVTSEKPLSDEAEPLDDELLAILEQVEALDQQGGLPAGER
ncbi:MAG: hypothetical protein RIB46_14015 [Pseudomonadales bacterium]